MQRPFLQAQQNQENREYVKQHQQNGHASPSEILGQQLHNHIDAKADDDLGFDPFHETQKALAELIETEQQQHQRLFQQRQQFREREEHSRLQHNSHYSQVRFGGYVPLGDFEVEYLGNGCKNFQGFGVFGYAGSESM